ncbi:hypothetical protein [Bacillus weihaiensis]|uniref:Uncharacterized protein n=1 Tax=Bacillus weihaiensis TaxID=1547283 RepID=A0A1L3MW01_9BACI|nr:hypothetical protein [Bacillus weihaiensis]APH06526.1 hypothetical protein A9C19_18330 [Bacillus weihaiensis]
MELVKWLNVKRKEPKYRETRFGIVSFVCAILTLAYFNLFLMTLDGFDVFSNLFLQIIPFVGIISAFLSFTRINYKKTFTWWAIALYLFMLICFIVIFFVEFATYMKP